MQDLIRQYEQGPALLRSAVAGMTADQFHARPVAGKWTTHELVCHLADAEMLYADRIKRVLAEEKPTLPGMDPDLHVPRLAIRDRNTQEELTLIELVRKQVLSILRTLKPDDFQRQGIHTEAGPLTLEDLLKRIAGHIPHHAQFIAEKRAAFAKV